MLSWKFVLWVCFLLPVMGFTRSSTSSDRFYKLLGLPRSADTKEISRAYRKLAVKWHPDKNRNNQDEAERKFKEITEAYEVLSNPEKRKMYDQFGESGLSGGQPPWGEPDQQGDGRGRGNFGGPFGGPFGANFGGRSAPQGDFGFGTAFGSTFTDFMADYLNQRWGGMGGSSSRRGARSPGGQEQVVELVCTLEDLYKGRVRRAPVSAVVMDAFSGMPQTREKTFTVSISKGWKEGTKIRYGAAADGFPPVTFVVKEARHPYFTRKDSDLVWRREITKEQAQRNLVLKIPCLDGSVERVRIPSGTVKGHVYVHRVKGKGMPRKKGGYGDLVIEIVVGKR